MWILAYWTAETKCRRFVPRVIVGTIEPRSARRRISMEGLVKLLALFSLVFCTVAAAAGEPAGGFTLAASELERYSGDFWEHEEAFAAEIRVVDGRLWAIHSPTRRNELVPVGPDRFEMIGMPSEVYVDYLMNESGIVEMRRSIDGQPRGVFIPFERRQITAEELLAYAGDYLNAESEIHHRLFVDGKLLFFTRGDADPQELTAMFGETFENPDYGSFTFQRDAGGAVTGFLLKSGPLRQLLFDRLSGSSQ